MCYHCSGETPGIKHSDLEILECQNCHESWPSMHYREVQLQAWKEQESLTLYCARCDAENTHPERINTEVRRCVQCKSSKTLRHFAPVIVKNILYPSERGYQEGRYYRCRMCQYPTCEGLSRQRHKVSEDRACQGGENTVLYYPPPANTFYKGKYLCLACRFPPCSGGCGRGRPEKKRAVPRRMGKEYVCLGGPRERHSTALPRLSSWALPRTAFLGDSSTALPRACSSIDKAL